MSKSVEFFQKKYRISPAEYEFFARYVENTRNGMKSKEAKTDAYIATHPGCPEDSQHKSKMAYRLYSQIYDKFGDNFADYLEFVGLGRDTLADEIRKGLKAKKIEFYKGEKLTPICDNATRARTRELLANVSGVSKKQVEVTETKKLDIDLSNLNDEELKTFQALLAKVENPNDPQ